MEEKEFWDLVNEIGLKRKGWVIKISEGKGGEGIIVNVDKKTFTIKRWQLKLIKNKEKLKEILRVLKEVD